MFANERYNIICGLLRSNRSVTVSELCERFNVSIETVRRDLAFLESSGKLMRVHGGAVALPDQSGVFGELSARINTNVDKKRELAEYAVKLVEEDDVIFVDSGSTAVEFMRGLCSKLSRLTVITYSSDIIGIAAEQRDFNLISLGGKYMLTERMFCGHMAESNMRMYHVNKCFICPSSLSLRYGAMLNIPEAFPIELAAMESSDKVYLLADSSKFEINAPLRLCDLKSVNGIITDRSLDAQIRERYRDSGIEVIWG